MKIKSFEEKDNLRERAIALLARREHSQHELRQKLLNKGYPSVEIETVLASLTKEGLQSDERYAEIYVRHRVGMGFGPRRITAELHQRGIAETLIRQYLCQDEAFWWSALSSVCQRKYHTKHNQDFNKQARFLMQRGFLPQQVYAWLKENTND